MIQIKKVIQSSSIQTVYLDQDGKAVTLKFSVGLSLGEIVSKIKAMFPNETVNPIPRPMAATGKTVVTKIPEAKAPAGKHAAKHSEQPKEESKASTPTNEAGTQDKPESQPQANAAPEQTAEADQANAKGTLLDTETDEPKPGAKKSSKKGGE